MRRPSFANLLPAAAFACLAPIALTGCGDDAEIRVYESAKPASYNWPVTQDREASHKEGEITWLWSVPAGWVDAPELSSFHAADYRFPGTNESLPGRLTVSVSEGDGGGVKENIQRWRGQLYLVPPKVPAPGDTVSPPMGVPIGQATIVELSGQYQGEFVPTHLLGAIVQIPAQDGSVFQTWFFKMLGDEQTILQNRIKLVRMILTLRPEGVPAPDLPEDLFERALQRMPDASDRAPQPAAEVSGEAVDDQGEDDTP